MSVYNIRFEFHMKIEQRSVVSCLHRKGITLPTIVVELMTVSHEDAIDENRVKYWLHEIELHRSDLSDQSNSGRPPLEDIDARILQVLEAEPWSLVRTIAEFLKSPSLTVHLHLTTSLNMKS
jgi:transposase